MYQDLLVVSGTLVWLVDLVVASKLVATAVTNPALQLVCGLNSMHPYLYRMWVLL